MIQLFLQCLGQFFELISAPVVRSLLGDLIDRREAHSFERLVGGYFYVRLDAHTLPVGL